MALSAAGASALALGAYGGPARAAGDPASWSGTLKVNERNTPNKIAYWEQLGARFIEKSPKLKFVVEPSDMGANYDTKLLTASISKTIGDLGWLVTTQNFNLFQSKGLVQPVDDLIKADGHDMSPYIKRALDAVTIDGKLYMIPTGFHGGPISMFYNKKLFDEAGIAYPTADWKLDDFEKAGAALTKPDKGQFGIMLELDNPEAIVVLSRCWGGDVLKDKGTKSALLSDGTRAMFEWVSDLINKKHISEHPANLPRLANGSTDYNGFFGAGKVAMWQASPWHINQLRTALGDKFGDTFDMTLMPPGPAGRNGQLVVEGYPIFSTTRNLEAAWAFTKFATTKQEGIDRIAQGFVAAPRVDAMTDPKLIASDIYYARYNQGLIDNPPAPASVPANNRITEMYSLLKIGFDGIWSGQKSVADVLKSADAQLNDLLSQS
jgi:multiple sugar transport system substrate-binding protein